MISRGCGRGERANSVLNLALLTKAHLNLPVQVTLSLIVINLIPPFYAVWLLRHFIAEGVGACKGCCRKCRNRNESVLLGTSQEQALTYERIENRVSFDAA